MNITPFTPALINEAIDALEASARLLEAKLIPGQDKANLDTILQIDTNRRAAEELKALVMS